MRFLADEGCDFLVARTLRALGHDVLVVSEFQSRSVDAELMELAETEGRILLTEDKDFGWLTFVARLNCPGVILFRFPAGARLRLAAVIEELIAKSGDQLEGAFTVVRPGSVRISRRSPTL